MTSDKKVLAGHHLGDRERCGNLSVGPLFEVVQQHHLSLSFGELL